MPRLVMLHGCCKSGPEAAVRAEGAKAAAVLGVGDPIVPYYAFALNCAGRADGHDPGCLPTFGRRCVPEGTFDSHDDQPWFDKMESMAERLDTPVFPPEIGMAVEMPSSEGAPGGALPEGRWPTCSFLDVHVFLGHPWNPEPRARQEVFDAILEDLPDREGFVLVAHSLGSLVAVDMIDQGLIAPSALVTVGSQLGWDLLNNWAWSLLPVIELDVPWVNIIDRRDLSAGFFSGDNTPSDNGYRGNPYCDVFVKNDSPPQHHDLVGYLTTTGAREAIGPLLG